MYPPNDRTIIRWKGCRSKNLNYNLLYAGLFAFSGPDEVIVPIMAPRS